jgi:hypothetical protein
VAELGVAEHGKRIQQLPRIGVAGHVPHRTSFKVQQRGQAK